MTGQESLRAARYEVVVLVGPAPETEVDDLMVAIAELPECKNVGGVVTSRRAAPRWGLFRAPEKWGPGELQWIRSGVPLPQSWRGFVSEHESREAASEVWREGLFVREIVDE